MNTYFEQLSAAFPSLTFKQEYVLAPLTTVKIGGPAEVFCQTKKSEDFADLVIFARQHDIPLTILGWGVNTLISDRGVRGLVVKNTAQQIKVHETHLPPISTDISTHPRWITDENYRENQYFTNNDDAARLERVRVEMDASVALPVAINTVLAQGITGLEWYARIPATIGGGIVNNIHGGPHFFEEIVERVHIITKTGERQELSVTDLDMCYDYSRFHHSGEIIISATFLLFHGDAIAAKALATTWAQRKSIQPQNSLGCVFQNISDEQREALAYPTCSVGYIVEHILGKKGFQIGDAKVSHHHAAFIENTGHATSDEYLEVIRTIIAETKEKTGIQLKPEIFFVGFEKEELRGVVSDQ